MDKRITTIGGVLILISTGCASIERSTLLGVSVGAAGGTGIGLAVEQSPGSALIGTAIGAFVGGVFGYLGHKEQDRRDMLVKVGARRVPLTQETPKIREPEANCITIEERIEANRYIGAHIMCTIERPATFSH